MGNIQIEFIFSYETVVKRWPIILTGVIDTIYRVDHEIGVSIPTLPAGSEEAIRAEEKINEGKMIIEKISKLKYDMARDRPLEYAILKLCLRELYLIS